MKAYCVDFIKNPEYSEQLSEIRGICRINGAYWSCRLLIPSLEFQLTVPVAPKLIKNQVLRLLRNPNYAAGIVIIK